MDFTLRIFFIGLIAFVPIEDKDKGDKLVVLLVEAREDAVSYDGRHIPRHIPLMHYSCRNRPGFQCTADETDPAVREDLKKTFGKEDGEFLKAGVLRLAEVEISLKEELEDKFKSRGDFGKCSPGVIKKPDGEATKDVSWFPDMLQIAVEKDHAQINPACIDEQASPPADLVVSRGIFKFGELVSAKLLWEAAHYLPYAFKPVRDPSDPLKCGQSLVSRASLNIPVSGCEATIDLRPYGAPESEGKKITLVPVDCNAPNAEVKVYISNRMECVKWNLGPPCNSAAPCCEDKHAQYEDGPHFELFYKLSAVKVPDEQKPIPFPHPLAVFPGGGDGDDRVICPTPRFWAEVK